MSTATVVPETYELSGDDAMDVLARVTPKALLRDSVTRMRAADGFSHSRATAFQIVLTLIPGAIVLVALAARFHWGAISGSLVHSIDTLAPGPASDVFRDAFQQGAKAGNNNTAAILGGGAALLISGTTVFGQIERTANRIYGVESDRRALRKYAVAFLLMVTAGLLVTFYFFAVAIGGGWDIQESVWRSIWNVLRWPLGALFLVAAFSIVFKVSPRRHQPAMSWLALGGLIGVGLSILSSVLLQIYLAGSGSFGDTYGPLAGFLGVMLWAYAGALSLYFGLAVAAQLEAVRAGRPEPQSAAKVELGDPDTAVMSYAAALHIAEHEEQERLEREREAEEEEAAPPTPVLHGAHRLDTGALNGSGHHSNGDALHGRNGR